MYQCQMGKQTMGTPCHAFPHRCARTPTARPGACARRREAGPCACCSQRLDYHAQYTAYSLPRRVVGRPFSRTNECSCDNKLYRLNTFQRCLVRNQAQDEYCMDEYPNGCNAVVAVLSYTGYVSGAYPLKPKPCRS